MWRRRGQRGSPGAVRDAAWGVEQQADVYEQGRPGYPAELMTLLTAEMALGRGTRVCDLAAGTGKLTRALLADGADVVAVEPVAAMRDGLVRACPGADVREGSAEAIPLPDSSVAIVTVAQAFHWFDTAAALTEIHRVLSPGGGLALVWNRRDTTVPWVKELGDTVQRYSGGKPQGRRDWPAVLAAHEGFGPVREDRFPNSVSHSAESLLARVASMSHVATLGPRRRAKCLRAVRKLVERHPAIAGQETFELPHKTVVYWCRRA